ncbi:MAG: hypothetical protein COZ21_14735 [Bacteroidetes bacterium CG_4_10_14_3_um_filter_31_20]|nr:hypothetical protein [Bacteroidota bacterium]NCQ11398.1 hypothetical protein [Bacteroidota bacterium]PIY02330.1 MAG: hypothetical protein COZ21_14735 [Bacteroidetes bacterium CG_4_10_14_3_um_filter_31_20]
MKKYYEIQYILRYYEEKDYASVIIKANSDEDALKKFAKIFDIKEPKRLNEPMFMWKDGQWMASFKCINEVEENVCPQCEGSGKIHLNK